MAITLHPQTYFLVDRVSKLVGLLAIVAGLVGLVGPFSLLIGFIGLVIGVSTIFIDVEDTRKESENWEG